MENTKNKRVVIPVIQKIWEDKMAISKCIREHGDLNDVARERNIIFAKPLRGI